MTDLSSRIEILVSEWDSGRDFIGAMCEDDEDSKKIETEMINKLKLADLVLKAKKSENISDAYDVHQFIREKFHDEGGFV